MLYEDSNKIAVPEYMVDILREVIEGATSSRTEPEALEVISPRPMTGDQISYGLIWNQPFSLKTLANVGKE